MHLFQFMKGALRMLKALSPRYTVNNGGGILGRDKYNLNEVSRSKIELPPDRSVLSMTKYFENEDSGLTRYDREGKKMD